MERTALLILNAQQEFIDRHPHHRKKLLERLDALVQTARKSKIDVLYIQRSDKDLVEGTAAWALAAPLCVGEGETVLHAAHHSAFRDTALREHLDARGIRTLIVAGLQTEYSIDTTCKVAAEYGYSVIIPAGATSTYNSCFSRARALIEYYEEGIWAGRDAAVLPFDDVVKQMKTP